MDYNNTIHAGSWAVRVPQFVHQEVNRLARIERRRPSDMLRILLEDALALRGINNNGEEMKKADAA